MKTLRVHFMMLMAAVMAFCLTACSSDDENNEQTKTETNLTPEPGFENLSEADYDNYVSDLTARLLFLLYDPNADYNDIELIDHYMNGLAYNQATTRGVWGQAKAAVDFALVLKDANALHRSILIGAMAKWHYSDKATRDEIWNDIRNSGCLPSSCNSYTSDQFWKEFSNGSLDLYAKGVYNAVMAKSNDSKSKTGDLAAEMAYNNLRHIDLTLAVAPKLIEAGANIVFAFGDDLVQNGKLAYDFVETNGTVVLQIAEGNLTAEAFMDACNNNLKLLTKGLKEVVPTSQDLAEVLSDLTTEQIKALNKEIEDAIQRAGNQELSKSDVALFVDAVKDIIQPEPWKMNFADITYEANDGSSFMIETDGKGYKFVYCDKNENVLLEAKCAVKQDYITIRVDYLDERCDLLPKNATLKDIFPIPYSGENANGAPDFIILWWNSNQHSDKMFHIKKEVLFTDLYAFFSMYCKPEGGSSSARYIHKITYTQDEITVSKQGKLYTLTAEKVENNMLMSVTMNFNDEGVDDDGEPIFSNILSLQHQFYPVEGYTPTGKNYWDYATIRLKNVKYEMYYKEDGKDGDDEWVRWTGYEDDGYEMDYFAADLKDVKDGETTHYIYAPEYGGMARIYGFYRCSDITKYN